MMYVPVSAPGDPALSRKCHPHPRLWWRVVGSAAKFLRPTEHFCPQSLSSQIQGSDHTWNQCSLQETFPSEAFDLCNIKERLGESRLDFTPMV